MIIDIHAHVTAPDSLYVYKAGLLSHRGGHGRGAVNATDEDIIKALNAPVFGGSSHLNQLKEAGTDMGYAGRDLNFQGYGRFETASDGEYRFRTIKPALYTGRTRHIHFKVRSSGRQDLTTQCYFQGEPQNANDGVLRGIRDERQRNSVIVAFTPVPASKVAALAGRFDIVLSA